jgi:uncharacterized protein YgiM (DUF1202 family)
MKKLFLLLTLTTLCGMVYAQQGKTMYVAVKNAYLKSSTGIFASKVSAAALGEPVTVVTDKGKWAQVKTAKSLTGWIPMTSLSSKRVTGSGYSASAGEIALAGKGFSAETELEYKKNGVDYTAVDSMEALNVSDDDLLKFINDGRLAKGE